jgi:hypothetical protein
LRKLAFAFVVLLAASACLAALAAAGAGGETAGSARTCGFIHASVPYSAHGQASKWRVYVQGASTCASATRVLDAVMHLQGKQHVGSSEADSYSTYAGWLCPSGDMGQQTCELPTRLPAHPPIRAHALARECSPPGGCPARAPASEL